MAIEVPCLLNSAVSTISQHRSLYQASHTTLTCVQVRLARIGHIAIDEAATLLLTRNAMCSCGMGTCMYKILMLCLLDDSCSGSVFFPLLLCFLFYGVTVRCRHVKRRG